MCETDLYRYVELQLSLSRKAERQKGRKAENRETRDYIGDDSETAEKSAKTVLDVYWSRVPHCRPLRNLSVDFETMSY